MTSHHANERDTMRSRRFYLADYVCWVDYLRPRAYRLYCKIPFAYRLYVWADEHSYDV